MGVRKITMKTIELQPGEKLELQHGEKLVECKIVIERVAEDGLMRLFKRSTHMPAWKAVCVLQCFEYDDEGRQS